MRTRSDCRGDLGNLTRADATDYDPPGADIREISSRAIGT